MCADFAKVKEKVSLEQAIALLGLKMELVYGGNQYRCACPVCEKPEGRSLVVTPGKGFYCFRSHKGGSVIDLVAHVKKMELKEAARWLLGEEVTISPVASEPQAVKQEESKGFPLAVCKATGIKFAKEVTGEHYEWKKPVSIPIRKEDGTLVCHITIQSAHLPKEWK